MKAKWHTIKGLNLAMARYDLARQFVAGRTVLDIACGDGIGAAYLLANGAKTVCGGDISADAVQHARKLCGVSASFAVLDACNLPFRERTFDVIVSIETIEHLEEQETFITECRRTLKEGGWFICSTVNRESFSPKRQKPWFPGHVKELSIGEFSGLLSKYLNQVTIYGIPGNEKPSRFARFIYRYESLLETLLLSFPPIRTLVRSVTRQFFSGYTLIRLDQVKPLNLEHYLTPKYKPFLLETNKVNPTYVIAVANK